MSEQTKLTPEKIVETNALIKSGYCGCNSMGGILDRRLDPTLIPMPKNEMMGIPDPLEVSMTKENFWNKIMEDCPGKMNEFCEWIDEYKAKSGWDSIFQGGGELIKYHDIPLAMQVGIFLQYAIEGDHYYNFFEYLDGIPITDMADYPRHIKTWFYEEEREAHDEHMRGKYDVTEEDNPNYNPEGWHHETGRPE